MLMPQAGMRAPAAVALAVGLLARAALGDLAARCEALSQPHLFIYQTCIALHEETPQLTWDQAVDSCDDIPADEDSAAGHLWHPTDTQLTVTQMLIDHSIQVPYLAHAGVYNVDQSGANNRGWWYIRNSSAAAEMLPDFWPWEASQPNNGGRRSLVAKWHTADYAVEGWDGDPASALYLYPHVCQYDKTAAVKWKRAAAHDGQLPTVDATLRTEHMHHRLLCIMSCMRAWGTSLCRAVAYEQDGGRCVHSLALADRTDKWLADAGGGLWEVWQLAP